MRKIKEPLKIIEAHIKDGRWKDLYNYIRFRLMFKVHPVWLSSLFRKINPYPPYLEIETSTACNLKCIQCENTYWDEKPENMSYERFLTIIDQFPKLKWICLTGIGEMLLNKDFLRMCFEVKRRGMFLELIDNFTLWDRKVSEMMVGIKLNHLEPSIDSPIAITYEKIRVGAKFETVDKNLKDLFAVKREKNAKLPIVSIHMVVNQLNHDEMCDMIIYAREVAKKDYVAVQFTETFRNPPGRNDLVYHITEDDIFAVEEIAKFYKVLVRWNRNIGKLPYNKCSSWTMPFIFVNGDVMPCCACNETYNRDRQRAFKMGNIFEKSFKDIWNGPRYLALRENLDADGCDPYCTHCCVYGKK